MSVPEVECRRNHIDLISSNHPLLVIALDCLNDLESDRPSAQEICEKVSFLKESAEYTDSIKEDGGEGNSAAKEQDATKQASLSQRGKGQLYVSY